MVILDRNKRVSLDLAPFPVLFVYLVYYTCGLDRVSAWLFLRLGVTRMTRRV